VTLFKKFDKMCSNISIKDCNMFDMLLVMLKTKKTKVVTGLGLILCLFLIKLAPQVPCENVRKNSTKCALICAKHIAKGLKCIGTC